MRFGVITDEISQDFQQAADLAAEYGLQGLEIRSVWEKGPHELSDADIEAICRIAANNNLAICGISSPIFKCDLDNPIEVLEHFAILEKCIALAQKTGAKLVRGFSFWAKDSFEQRFEEIAAHLCKAGQMLESTDLTFALEFDPSVYAYTGAMAAELVEAIDHSHVKLLWDPGNDVFVRGEVPYPDGYERVRNLMVHVHIKDAHRETDEKVVSVPVGRGDVDYEGQFRALQQDGYAGWVVLETHYRVVEELDQGLLDMPKGSAFSAGGYEATRICLKNMKQLVQW